MDFDLLIKIKEPEREMRIRLKVWMSSFEKYTYCKMEGGRTMPVHIQKFYES